MAFRGYRSTLLASVYGLEYFEYLVANDEQPLCTRIWNDYKEGTISFPQAIAYSQ